MSTRDVVLQHGALPALVELGSTFSDATPLSLVRNVSRTLHNLCRKKPAPPLDLVSPALPLLARLIHNTDEKTVADACWALYHMSYGSNDRIEAVLQAGVAPRLVELLHDETTALSAALCTVSNFVTGDEAQTQRILDLNVLPTLLKLLGNSKKNIRKEAAWAVSNIACGTQDQIQAVIEAGLVPKLIELIQTADADVQKEAAWAVSNTTCGGDADQIMYLVQQGAIPPLCNLLDSDNDEVVEMVLEGLQNILIILPPEEGWRTFSSPHAPGALRLKALDQFLQCDGVKKIKALGIRNTPQTQQSLITSNRARSIIETYFPKSEDV